MADEALLVVDDDPFMRELLAESFSDAGYQVASAETGKEALHLLSLSEFQVILVDLSLPDVGGMELVDQISNGYPEAQIVIMTGYPSLDSAIEALRRGAQDYIVKPFKIPEVQAAVSRALKSQRLQAEVRELRHRVRDLEQEASRLRAAGPAAQPTAPRARRVGPLPGAYGTMSAYRSQPAPEQAPQPEPLAQPELPPIEPTPQEQPAPEQPPQGDASQEQQPDASQEQQGDVSQEHQEEGPDRAST